MAGLIPARRAHDAARIAIAWAWAGLVVLGAWASAAQAQVLSPGPLARDHAELDRDDRCDRCHEAGRGTPDGLCVECHRPIGQRISAGRGFHGKAGRTGCAGCHREHLGVEAPLVRWPGGSPEAFPHERAGFALRGAHADVKCRDCHTAARIVDADVRSLAETWLGLSATCNGCHRDDDPHRRQFGDRACSACHGDTDWKPLVGFDHGRTKFPLRGKHERVECAKCHADSKWAGAPTACGDCHRNPHPAATKFPADCARCHVAEGWAEMRYVRAEHRAFPLAGGHRDVTCVACHGDDGNRAPRADCAGCHTDPHAGRLSRNCASCHRVEGWKTIRKTAFEHDRTRFPLQGAHLQVACASCHRGGRMAPIAHEACTDCHADPHRDEAPGACDRCHDLEAFRPSKVGVEAHGATFPLVGAHRAVRCDGCHRIDRSWSFRRGVARCVECHRDPHAGQFEPRTCEDCHAPEAWSSARVDHSIWPLAGVHAKAACAGCHPNRTFAGTSRACRDCHGDPHLGQFVAGAPVKACDACHTPEAWRGGFDHAPVWPLEGAHGRAACGACHKEVGVADDRRVVRWRLGFRDCARCHENVHRRVAP